MWNLTYTNRVCNEHERFRDHRTHVNKLLMVRTHVETKSPYVPLFLSNKCNNTQNVIERKIKIDYENNNLIGKIKSIERTNSVHHPRKIIVKECPAYTKTLFVKHKTQKHIDIENSVFFLYSKKKMYQRLKSARPTYSYNNFEKDYRKNQYIESLHKFKVSNPNMFFETPEKFNKKLQKEIGLSMSSTMRGSMKGTKMSAGFKSDI